MSHWHGPQWVLVTTWAFYVLPCGFRASGARVGDEPPMRTAYFLAQQLSNLLSRAALAAVLAWGGFFN